MIRVTEKEVLTLQAYAEVGQLKVNNKNKLCATSL